MRRGLQPYREYRDSGVAWLGDVPSHWEIRRVRHAFFALSGATPSHDERNWDGDIVWVTPEDLGQLRTRDLETSRRRISERGYQSCGTCLAPADSIAISTRAPIGYVAIVRVAACVNQGCRLLVPRRGQHVEYHFFQLLTLGPELQSLGQGSTFVELGRSRLLDVRLACPPAPEQRVIADYLAHVDRSVTRFTRNRRRLITLLNEQKQAIINQAVTRGLDPIVRLKPSGVDWLGDIPEHWQVRKLKHEVSFTGGGTPSKSVERYWHGDIPWVSPKDMKHDSIVDSSEHVSDEAIADSATNLVEPGAVLMVVRSGILRRTIPTAVNRVAVALNQDMKALRSTGAMQAHFLKLLIEGCQPALLLQWIKTGATVESIEYEDMANTPIPIPPINEQESIVRHIGKEVRGVSMAIDLAQREIDLIREYRTRLISDVVTGKVDVRGLAAGLEDELIEAEDLSDDLDNGDMPDEDELALVQEAADADE